MINNIEYRNAENKMQSLLKLATKKGDFDFLTEKETKELEKNTLVVKNYEEKHIVIPFPETIQGIIELKMCENILKQKEIEKY